MHMNKTKFERNSSLVLKVIKKIYLRKWQNCTLQTRSYNLTAQVLQTNQVSRASLYLIHPVASLTARNIAMMLEHIYGVASFIVMQLIVLLCVFKMYLARTATCREHRAFLLESTTREEQQRVNRGQKELEADRRCNVEEERLRGFASRRLPVQHDERRCPGVSIRFIHSFMIDFK